MTTETPAVFEWSILSIEKSFDFNAYHAYHVKYWQFVFVALGLYFLVIHFGEKWMKHRERFSLRSPLFYWNLCLSVFSVIGMIRTLPELLSTLTFQGLHHAICFPPNLDGFYGLWVIFFIHSKVFELGDTVFIILRKQRLIFLHWYHHMTVLFCVYFTITRPLSTMRWYVTTNYTVHAVMYSYYCLKARGWKLPKLISAVITAMQLTQMVIAFSITSYAWIQKSIGNSCEVDAANIALGIICYGSYFYLFARFFRSAYLTKSSSITKKPFIDVDANRNAIKSE